jgi:lipopolysaccharide export system permease protein
VNGLLPLNMIAELIGLRVLIALEVLVPISLYISVVLAFGKLYGDAEFTAMYALRVSPARVMGTVLVLASVLAVGVAGVSLLVRPWAYQKSHELSGRAEAMLDVGTMEAGTFYSGDHGNRVIFFGRRDGPTAPAHDVFVRLRRGQRTEIIRAGRAYPLGRAAADQETKVLLRDVSVYEIGEDSDQGDQVLTAAELVLGVDGRPAGPPAYSPLAASSLHLAASEAPDDIAELQWRLSTPVSTLLLGLLGVPLSRAQPRQSRYAKFGTVILIYSAYYLLCSSARTWVQHGQVAEFPGLWWAPTLLALVLLAAVYAPSLRYRFGHGRA